MLEIRKSVLQGTLLKNSEKEPSGLNPKDYKNTLFVLPE